MKDYDMQHVNNLEMMSKKMLMKEYIVILRKNEALEMRLGVIHERENKKIREQKYRDCLQQMEEELESLRKQNQTLQRHNSEIHELLEQKSEFYSTEGASKGIILEKGI